MANRTQGWGIYFRGNKYVMEVKYQELPAVVMSKPHSEHAEAEREQKKKYSPYAFTYCLGNGF